MAIDRDTTLRKAEKFLRQGRLDNAIAEYLPRRRGAAPRLEHRQHGRRPARPGRPARERDRALHPHRRPLLHEGFLPRAAAVYKKILKLKPDQEHAALRTAEISEKQGLLVDAKAALTNVAERRLRRGDRRGAAEIQVRSRASSTRRTWRRAGGRQGGRRAGRHGRRRRAAVRLAAEFQRARQARREPAGPGRGGQARPGDTPRRARRSLARFVEGGRPRAGDRLRPPSTEFKAIAAELFGRGRGDEALLVLERALEQDPERHRDPAPAGPQLHRPRATSNAPARCLRATSPTRNCCSASPRSSCARAHADAAASCCPGLVQLEPARREELVLLGCRLCEHDGEAGFQCIDVATDAAIADHDWPAAASALHEYVTRVPGHVPALMKLVEVCVDGGLEATMYTAQAQLADAYLEAGRANEARVIAEDLVAREPWEASNIERFRRALVMLGEPDPDGVIADRLSGDSPFTSSDFVARLRPQRERAEPAVAPRRRPAARRDRPSRQRRRREARQAAASGGDDASRST